jgi:toxin ParE1/3/4
MQIVWTAPAIADLGAARRYIALDNPAAAIEQVEYILAAVETLPRFPQAGRLGRTPGTRELVVPRTPFVVPYRRRTEAIEVLRVLLGRRAWPESL